MISQIVVVSCLITVALSAFIQYPVPILYARSDVSPDGSFLWNYRSGDGSRQEQFGQGGQAVQGSAQWYDPQGQYHRLKYIADENGYQPQSADLPVGPGIPAAILKSLQWNAAHPEEESY